MSRQEAKGWKTQEKIKHSKGRVKKTPHRNSINYDYDKDDDDEDNVLILTFSFAVALRPNAGHGLLILEVF